MDKCVGHCAGYVDGKCSVYSLVNYDKLQISDWYYYVKFTKWCAGKSQ